MAKTGDAIDRYMSGEDKDIFAIIELKSKEALAFMIELLNANDDYPKHEILKTFIFQNEWGGKDESQVISQALMSFAIGEDEEEIRAIGCGSLSSYTTQTGVIEFLTNIARNDEVDELIRIEAIGALESGYYDDDAEGCEKALRSLTDISNEEVADSVAVAIDGIEDDDDS